MSEHNTQKHSFQAEVAQLLHLVTHSLYSNPEIFLRELISNASDACDKLRFEGINHPEFYENDPNLHVRIILDKEQKEILYQAELNCVMKTATNLSRQYSILDIINQWLNDNDVKAKRENTAVLFNYNP